MSKYDTGEIMTRTIRAVTTVLMTVVWMLFAVQATAQSNDTYPNKPVRIIVPFPAGALMDATARILGKAVSNSIGQPVIIENRPGGSFIIGNLACAKAAPDGYTICLNTNTYTQLLFTNLPYDPVADFAPIIHLAGISSMLVANAKAPFNSFKELIAFAKANPGSINWGTWGPNTSPDIHLRWINHEKGVQITGIPYKGGTQTIPAVTSGEIHITQLAVGFSVPMIKAGKLKPVAIIGDRRSPMLPDVPALSEERANNGIMSYFGLFTQAKTPKPIIDRLNSEFNNALQTSTVKAFYRKTNLEPTGGSAEKFGEFLKLDGANAAKVFETIGVRPTAAP